MRQKETTTDKYHYAMIKAGNYQAKLIDTLNCHSHTRLMFLVWDESQEKVMKVGTSQTLTAEHAEKYINKFRGSYFDVIVENKEIKGKLNHSIANCKPAQNVVIPEWACDRLTEGWHYTDKAQTPQRAAQYKMRDTIRRNHRMAWLGEVTEAKRAKAERYLNCTLEEYRDYLKDTAKANGVDLEAMTYGTDYHIDHKKPLASYTDLTDENQKREALNHTNTQLMLASENLNKGDMR